MGGCWMGCYLAILISAVIFSTLVIVLSIIPLKLFYVPSPEGTKSFLTYWYFLVPYGIIQGVIGAYAGMTLGKQNEKKIEINQMS